MEFQQALRKCGLLVGFLFFILILGLLRSDKLLNNYTIITHTFRHNTTSANVSHLPRELTGIQPLPTAHPLIRNRTQLNITMTTESFMQYKIAPNDSNIPKELRGGHAMLKARSYPKTPRRPSCDSCFKYVYNTTLRPTSCDAKGEIKMLIFLTTVPQARQERDAIRNTWLSVTKNNTKSVRYMWLLGSGWPAEQQAQLEKEHQLFGDILQDNYIDSYFNLSIKVMGGFNFAHKTNCSRAEFVMRTADDGYVNIPNVLNLLQREGNHSKLQHGMFGPCKITRTLVVRRKSSKWAVTLNEWGPRTYPPYCAGTTFMMSTPTMNKLYKAAENVPYFVMEDVYFGLVGEQAKIPIVIQKSFLLGVPRIDVKQLKQPCGLIDNDWRALHQVPWGKQLEIWQHCQKSKNIPP